ncbi:HAMP domain-containing sensor histidine kinase [uncultured Luteimonas sp.]|uniref:sensor histidine kinase n=1 Tax=uncultured Luteimonas sp. TaxID=453144 RepID=UPI00260423E5|nr:HAMP domain-containing sensor histidine kinase [uncultured Luteimonas sp.]
MPQGLPRKIRYAFVTQGLLLVLAVVFGVSLLTLITRDALVRQRLTVEADAFWARQGQSGSQLGTHLPSTGTLEGYFRSAREVRTLPPYVESLPEGVNFVYRSHKAVLVQRRPEGVLYLVLRTRSVDRLMGTSAAIMILLGLLTALVITTLTYRKSRRMVLPVNRLAEEVARWDPNQGDLTSPLAVSGFAEEPSREVQALAHALHGLSARVAEFVQRERDFTRDASHELRTPLTVIRVASDMMLSDPSLPPHGRRPLERIQRAARDMEAVIDAFLVLARESGVAPVSEELDVCEVVLDEVEKARPLLFGKPVDLRLAADAAPKLFAPPSVLAMIVRNLIQNACNFTEQGSIEVRVEADAVVVRDSGIGMSAETLQHVYDPFFRADAFSPLGKGFGLTIANRLVRRFGWQLRLDSVEHQGTTATLRFSPIAPS